MTIGEARVTPLQGVRVLDLSRVMAGPFGTMILGDLGAEVIKIEHPVRGDEIREWNPPGAGGEGSFYLCGNRNKESVGVDLGHPEGRALAVELAKICDVLVENFRPGTAKRFGLDYLTLSAINPRLIYCSVTGFGQDSILGPRAAYDPVAEAMSGFMAMNGEPDGVPVRAGTPISDYTAALYATIAVLAALRARDLTGRGQNCDIAMVDCTLSIMGNMPSAYFCTGEEIPRTGNGSATVVPIDVYDTADKKLYVLAGNDSLFRRLADVIGQPELAEDARYAANAARIANRDSLMEILRSAFLTDTQENWMAKLDEAGIPYAPIRGIAETVSAPDVLARGMVEEVDHPTIGPLKMVASPLKLSDTPVRPTMPPPTLGQHTDAVLGRLLDLDQRRLAQLRAAGAIG